MNDDGYFGEEIAAHYDDDPAMFDPALLARTVGFLRDHARGGAALEFAVGTGRVALPLAAAGVPVAGIELSQAMVARMRAKPGGADIPTVIGDMTTARVEGVFSLVYLVFNTIMNLTTQEAQVACFQNAAAHLAPGGVFVVEVMLPQLQRLPEGERFVPFEISDNHWDVDEYDLTTQGQVSHHLHFEGNTVRRNSVPFRYVWPSELDLMARLAGMELVERWADWDRAPFDSASTKHVSVWKRMT